MRASEEPVYIVSFGKIQWFTFLHLISPVHVVHPLRNKQTNKLGGQHKMYQRDTVLDVARQPLWRYVKGHHSSCDDTCSFATNLKIVAVTTRVVSPLI
jgi:hypothetical protein